MPHGYLNGGVLVRARRGVLWVGLAIALVVGMTVWASAKAPDTAMFKQLYAPKEGTDLAKALPCLVCHAKMPPTKTDLNPYGADMSKAAAGKAVDEKTMRAIEKLDSDKDGASNIVEIKAGTHPGDPKSKPK